jgi:hypothetical protein
MRRLHLQTPAPGDPRAVSAIAADAAGDRFACHCDANPLEVEGMAAIESLAANSAPRIIAWSGSMADALFARSPLTWMPTGRAAFESACARLRDAAARSGATILLRPHARHALSDAPSSRRWADTWRSQHMGLLFDPASLFEPAMLPDAADHLPRLFEALGPACDAILLASAQADPDADAPTRLVPLGEGALDPAQLAALAAQWAPEHTPVITLTPACHALLGQA